MFLFPVSDNPYPDSLKMYSSMASIIVSSKAINSLRHWIIISACSLRSSISSSCFLWRSATVISVRRVLLFPLLQSRHDVIRFRVELSPPSATGTMWSTSRMTSGADRPQYWHLKESLLNTSKRIFFDIGFLFSATSIPPQERFSDLAFQVLLLIQAALLGHLSHALELFEYFLVLGHQEGLELFL